MATIFFPTANRHWRDVQISGKHRDAGIKLTANVRYFIRTDATDQSRRCGRSQRELTLCVSEGFFHAADKRGFVKRDSFFHRRCSILICSAIWRTAFLPSAEMLSASPLVKRQR